MWNLRQCWQRIINTARYAGQLNIYIGKAPRLPDRISVILFPYQPNILCCGLTGIINIQQAETNANDISLRQIKRTADALSIQYQTESNILPQLNRERQNLRETQVLWHQVRCLKTDSQFVRLLSSPMEQQQLEDLGRQISQTVRLRESYLKQQLGLIESHIFSIMSQQIELLKDIAWCFCTEISANLHKIAGLSGLPLLNQADRSLPETALTVYKKINTVLNSLDRLEVRGRDSAGISLLFMLYQEDFDRFISELEAGGLIADLQDRARAAILVNGGIGLRRLDSGSVSIAMTYKVAAEIGKLGDNTEFIRQQITHDKVFHLLAAVPYHDFSVISHTRWASIGAISEPNCHPLDNLTEDTVPLAGNDDSLPLHPKPLIHVCLNGDIDNHKALKAEMEAHNLRIHEDITTDTKIIPLRIEYYLNQGVDVAEAFRLAVNDFQGSHAIAMHSDLAPGQLFLAQKGSGQAIFIGLAPDHYIPTSEVYGFIEDTQEYLKLDGEKQVPGIQGTISGQIFILNPHQGIGLQGIQAIYYDGSPVVLNEDSIKRTVITSRDIDRQEYPHYFLKEISESPASVEKTLENRWLVKDDQYQVNLDENVVPARIKTALMDNKIRRICFIGQGTAGVAALACANTFKYYLQDLGLVIAAYKSSELSGFNLEGSCESGSMSDTLVIAITQSGTTTDTNRAVDMVRELGAYTIAIVNRRDSDITFKVDGVMYTSSGRDIEMSVASTKAFYAQIIAGNLLGLHFAGLTGKQSSLFITRELQAVLQIPEYMRQVLTLKHQIKQSAELLSPTKIYWAVVGSGPNKAAADEIRIKLSELCYKTISSDFVEDKKHIDLSSEPLIIVCAAGSRDTVIGDIIKDTAIFNAHKATPVVISDEGELRFAPYADSVFYVPKVSEHLSPILNTLVGHLWGYYAALAINESSKFIFDFRESIKHIIDDSSQRGMDIYELILEKKFREKIAAFYIDFKRKFGRERFSSSATLMSDLMLLLKYMTGKLPVSDFELDFDRKGTAVNILNTFFETTGEMINKMARPVDAIKHQAKTVTVGTSRVSEKLTGILFDILQQYQISESQLTPINVIVLRNLQKVVEHINGSILYRISGLTLLGDTTEQTAIHVEEKTGILKNLPSRVETDHRLTGTKKTIVRQGNVYIGKGRLDGRSILIIPIISNNKDTPYLIEYLLLLNIRLNCHASLEDKIKALGGKYENIKNIVQESSLVWKPEFIEYSEIEELFGKSAEKIAESIVWQHKEKN